MSLLLLGKCIYCGNEIYWDTDEEEAIFSNRTNCHCRTKYPKEFLDVWILNSWDDDLLEDAYEFYLAGVNADREEI